MKPAKLILYVSILIVVTITVVILVMMNLGIIDTIFDKNHKTITKQAWSGELVDDWCYDPKDSGYDGFGGSKTAFALETAGVANASDSLGLSVGGAKDINNFRENIENGYFPLETDITYEGIYYDYSFDTGNSKSNNEGDKLFYPSYSTAVSKDPISGNEEYYVSVGLNSNIKESDFSRKNLNLVLVLDISGSMDSPMDEYYYDQDYDRNAEYKSKMQVAEESINVLLDQLKPEDSVGLVLFDNEGYLAKPLNYVGETDIEAIKEHVLEINAMGGTNFEAGVELANDVFEEYGIKNKNEYENRMIILTDAMPNIGETSSDGLRKMMEENSKKGIYTTFIGVGLDFNTEVVKNITDVRGANYYSVSSEEEFRTRMGEEFEYMVTPLVFDLNMDLVSNGFEVVNVYGTDSYSSENQNIMHVNTLFPSKTNDDGEVRGGIIVLKLKKLNDDAKDMKLRVSYETRDGKYDSSEETVTFEKDEEYYDNTGIRKGILLARYVNLIKNWTEYERSKDDRFLIVTEYGITDYPVMIYEHEWDDGFKTGYYSENERTSVELTVSNEYKEIFTKFKTYMESEINEIGDDDLTREISILDEILKV